MGPKIAKIVVATPNIVKLLKNAICENLKMKKRLQAGEKMYISIDQLNPRMPEIQVFLKMHVLLN